MNKGAAEIFYILTESQINVATKAAAWFTSTVTLVMFVLC